MFWPGLDGLNNWATEPKSIPKQTLDDFEKAEYEKLLADWTEDDILTTSDVVDESHLLEIHGKSSHFNCYALLTSLASFQ